MPKRTHEELRKERFEVAKRFADAVVRKYGPMVKAVVTWGSITRKEQTFKATSDIDCLVIIDDTAVKISDAQRAQMDNEVHRIAHSTDKRISIQPVWLLTEFWDMVRTQSPLAYSVLREGWALYDTGFFIPLRKLYERGRFPATTEAAYIRMAAVPKRIRRVEGLPAMAVFEDLFYAELETAQAILMFLGFEPPGIRGSPAAVRTHLVDAGLLESKWADELESIVKFHKAVEHDEIKRISGAELDKWVGRTKAFVARFEKLLAKLENDRKAAQINRMTEVALKAGVVALKAFDKLPKEPADIPAAVQKHLVEANIVNPAYAGLLEKLLSMQKAVREGRLAEVPESTVFYSQDYVRKFVIEVRKVLREHQFTKRPKGEK
jgi:predicted nucleotidyltransferase/uncharacterized protein (UPF0332 family)